MNLIKIPEKDMEGTCLQQTGLSSDGLTGAVGFKILADIKNSGETGSR